MALARAVRPEAFVEVVAPASPFDEALLRRSVDVLQAKGFRVRFRPDIFDRRGFLAGDDERRLNELVAALGANDSDVIWCARGGYGATRLLEKLPLETIRRANKLLVGFSDISALHARWLKAGVPSIHGGMVARFVSEPSDVAERLVMLIRDGGAPPPLSGQPLTPGVAEGVLTGGNLMVLSAMCGTPFQPDFHEKILFLEDVGERPYRVDRMLVQVAQAGLFKGVAGVALGEFVDCEQTDATSRGVLREHLGALGVPALSDLPCGHGAINQAMPFGVRARLDADAGRLEFLEPIHARGTHVSAVLT